MRAPAAALLVAALCAPIASAQQLQYRSLGGVEFRSQPDTGGVARARDALAADPRNVDRIIQLGLAQSAVRQYNDAIVTFSRGMQLAPDNPLLYRWRGHRFISIGALNAAQPDLTRGRALDSTNYDIRYHLGIVYFGIGAFANAADEFRAAQSRAPNDDEVAGSTDWLWMSLARAGRADEAQASLAPVTDSLEITSATAYAQRLRLYRGLIGPDEVLTPADTASVAVATLSFGVGNWYLARGDSVNARRWFERAVASGGWPGFGFLLAERELQRMK